MPTNKQKRWLDKFATKATKAAGSNYTFKPKIKDGEAIQVKLNELVVANKRCR